MNDPTTTRIDTPAGLALAVHDWHGDGPPVLLAHPTGFHGQIWSPVVEHLQRAGRHAYSFDFRGHGNSDAPEGETYSWHHFADDVLAVTEHLGIAGRADLLAAGHSKGAASLLLGELQRPGTFPTVWAFEPIMFPTDEPLPPSDDFPLAVGARRRRNEWTSIEEAYQAYASKAPLKAMAPASLRAYVEYGLRDRGDGVYVLKCSPEVEARVYTMGPNHGLFTHLANIGARVTVACGARTDAIPPRLAEQIVARLAHGTLEVWDGHGHFGPQADPERAARSILASATAP